VNETDIQDCIRNNTIDQLFTETGKSTFLAQPGLAKYQLLSVSMDKSTIRDATIQFALADIEFIGQILDSNFDWYQNRTSALAHAYTQIISNGLRTGIDIFLISDILLSLLIMIIF